MRRARIALSSALLLAPLACKQSGAEQAPPPAAAAKEAAIPAKPTAADAKAFAKKVNADLKALWGNWERAEWIKSTYIIHDTQVNAAYFHEKVMEYTSAALEEATKFDGLELDPDTQRTLHLLKVSQSMPAPNDAAKRKRLAEISAEMEGIYGKGKSCDDKGNCKTLGELSKVLAESHDYDELLAAWTGWRTISPKMRPMYADFVSIANEGAQEIGFDNLGEAWRAAYDMSPAEFEAETDRLWGQVRPLYEQLHCYVRGRLAKKYGKDKVDPEGMIPAHLLGNMWAQEWANIYPLVEPYRGAVDIDVTKALRKKGVDEVQLVKMAEGFFTSLGLNPLPETFWERSQFVKPKDREVVCHASAWDVGMQNDLRIKMCIKIDEEDLITVHHELGHNYYYMYYYTLPALYQQGAHDGFHEGIGDTLALSVTPGYLKEIGILKSVKKNDKALVNLQMKEALDKIAFLPFGRLIDQWRWDVFSGKVPPDKYNEAWWALREKYQGIKAPVARTEQDFDPGAKYHIPSNVPYTRYFLARILQFQFHKALCAEAGHTGPLHECSIYGSKAAGEKLSAMLSLGASKPWPDALEAIAGTRQMDGSALVEYFDPLMKWLEKQNQGKKCGW